MNAYSHLEQHMATHKQLLRESEKNRLANSVSKSKPSALKILLMQVLTLLTRS